MSQDTVSTMIIFLHDMDNEQEEQDLHQVLERLHTDPDEYRTSDEILQAYETELTDFAAGLSDAISLEDRLRISLQGINTAGTAWQEHEAELADFFARSSGDVDLEDLPFSDLEDPVPWDHDEEGEETEGVTYGEFTEQT